MNIHGTDGDSLTVGLPEWRSPTVRTIEFKGFTYFYQAGAQIKIGFSARPERRLKQLQRAVKMPLKVLLVVPSDMAPEYDTHQLFDRIRLRGEWFRADRELLYFIEGLKVELAERKAAELSAAPALTPAEATIRDLYCRMHTFPERARPFARNIIEFLKNGAMTAPKMGDHRLQNPRVHLQRHMERFEQAMNGAQ